jgi:hypothetical protein
MTVIVNMIWQLSGEIRHKWKTRERQVRYDMSLYFLENRLKIFVLVYFHNKYCQNCVAFCILYLFG